MDCPLVVKDNDSQHESEEEEEAEGGRVCKQQPAQHSRESFTWVRLAAGNFMAARKAVRNLMDSACNGVQPLEDPEPSLCHSPCRRTTVY